MTKVVALWRLGRQSSLIKTPFRMVESNSKVPTIRGGGGGDTITLASSMNVILLLYWVHVLSRDSWFCRFACTRAHTTTVRSRFSRALSAILDCLQEVPTGNEPISHSQQSTLPPCYFPGSLELCIHVYLSRPADPHAHPIVAPPTPVSRVELP